MKTKTLISVLAVASLAFFAHAGEKIIKNGDTLVFMGDSITQYGKERSHGYPNLVVKGLAANGINVTWHGVGICGNTSADMIKRFDNDVISKKPDVVTISAGVNDVWFGKVNFDQFCQYEREMVKKVKDAGAKAVLLPPTTAMGEADNPGIRKYAGAVKQIAAEEKLPYAPVFEMIRAWIDDADTPVLSLQNNISELRATYDGVHMTPAGDRVMARATLKGLGLNADEMSVAEAAWNSDESLVPLITPPFSSTKIEVFLNDAEAKAVSGLTVKQILDRGIPALAAKPELYIPPRNANNKMAITSSTGTFSYKAYDQLLLAARQLGIPVTEAIKRAFYCGVHTTKAPLPGTPVASVNDVLCGATVVTFDATVSSVGATASACDVTLIVTSDANNLGDPIRIAVSENGSFTYLLKGLKPKTTYAYVMTFENNATTVQTTVIGGKFTTKEISDAIQPSGEDDTPVIQAAINAAVPSKGKVTLGEGLFRISAELMVTGGVSLVGQDWKKTTIRQTAAHRVVTLKDGSELEGITVTGGKTTSNWRHGAGVLVEDGTVSGCRIWRNHAAGNNVFGGGVHIAKGRIVHSVIAFNQAGGNTSAGGGIGWRYSSGPVEIDTCLIYGNTVKNGNGGGLCFVMGNPDVLIRNTTIADNFSKSAGGGLYIDANMKKVKLANCIISQNTAESGEIDLAGTPASDSFCNIIGGTPAFKDPKKGDFHLGAGSDAIKAGKWPWTEITFDLDGIVRKEPLSAGCYE